MEQRGDHGQEIASLRRSERVRGAKRSRKGCPECRQRKIKCDERRPQCGQCRKGNRECHLQDSVFKRYAFSQERGVTTAPAITPIDASLSQGDRTAQISADLDGRDRGNNLSAQGAHQIAAIPQYSRPRYHLNQSAIDPFPPNTPVLPNPGERAEPETQHVATAGFDTGDTPTFFVGNDAGEGIELANSSSLTAVSIPEETTIESLKDTQEELFLLRHYSECIAPWMDLLYRYEVFSREVLTLARTHPILRYAACAVAAKQLGQIKRPLDRVVRGKTQLNIAKIHAGGRLGFLWYGIKYYEKAIQTLVKSIAPREPQAPCLLHNHVSPAVSLSQGDLMVRAEGEDPIVRLLGTCILIQYEHLSANRDAWSGHLTGFSKLLDLIDDGNILQPYPLFEQVYPWTKDIMEVKAGFWNFVANDLEESFVSNRRTRIDTENFALWRNMGLLIDDSGRLTLMDGPQSLSSTPEHARDKVLSYTLIRLLCKLVDYLVLPPSDWNSRTAPGESIAMSQNDAFLDRESEFDHWFQIISPSFHPDGTFAANAGHKSEAAPSGLFDSELWFSNDLCSTTMMYYHMARMLLIIHRPPDLLQGLTGSLSSDLLRTFHGIEQKLRFHARQVIATVRGTPCDAVKLRAIQPLYVAGRCCRDAGERRMLVGMLTDIQDSLGIATQYRIKALLQEWDGTYRNNEVEARLAAEEEQELGSHT